MGDIQFSQQSFVNVNTSPIEAHLSHHLTYVMHHDGMMLTENVSGVVWINRLYESLKERLRGPLKYETNFYNERKQTEIEINSQTLKR